MFLPECSTLAWSRPHGEGLSAPAAPLSNRWRAYISGCVQQREEQRGGWRMHVNKPQSIAASVELRIHNGRDFYVEGDAICGDVLLAAPPEWHVHSLRVEVSCTEHVRLPGHGSNTLWQYKEATGLLRDKPQSGAAGSYEYTVTIPDKHGSYPPSLDVAEAPECGVRWRVRALAEFTVDGDSARQTREDSLAVKVLHKPSKEEVIVVNELSHNKSRSCGFTCALRKPKWIPQAPEPCSVIVGVQFEKPAVVRYVSMYVDQCVVMWLGSESKVYRHRRCLGAMVVNHEVEKLEIDGASRGWRVEGPLVPAFRSMCFCVQYNLCVRVKFRGRKKATLWWRDIRVSSPDPGWVSQKGACGAAEEGEPPAYSETHDTSLL